MEEVAYASIGTATPTPFQPIPPTLIPSATPIPSPTPILNPYDFEGINFGIVSEMELLTGIKFNPNDKRNITIRFDFPDGTVIEVKFLPIPYFDWMEDKFDEHCSTKSGRACIYPEEGHLSIKVHSGCDPYPKALVGEDLRVFLEGWERCDFPLPLEDDEYLKRQTKLKEAAVSLINDNFVLEGLRVVWVENFPQDKVKKYSKSYDPFHLFGLITEKWKPTYGERYILLHTSGREKGCVPEYSCDRWLIILTRK